MKKKQRRVILLKQGEAHPKHPDFGFVEARLKQGEADKLEHDILDKKGIRATRQIHVPEQHLIYASPISRAKTLRLSPKTPKLR